METLRSASAPARGLRAQALDLLRFPLAVIVVLSHTIPSEELLQSPLSPFLSGGGMYAAFGEVQSFVAAFFREQSVPVYFFISGYVFFLGAKWSRETYLQKLKNRTKTLLIPYLIWNTISLLYTIFALACLSESRYFSGAESGFSPNLSGLLSAYWCYDGTLGGVYAASYYPINGPLWFVRDLMIVVLCAPLLHRIIERGRHYPILALGGLWIAALFVPQIDCMGFATAFFFFAWGAYMSIHKKDMIAEFGRFFKASMILYPLLGLLGFGCMHLSGVAADWIKQLNIVAGLFFAYNLAVWLLRKGYCKGNSFLAASSFFIYVSHMLVCPKLAKIFLTLFRPDSAMGAVGAFAAAFLSTVALCLGTCWFLKRCMPSVLKVLTGRK